MDFSKLDDKEIYELVAECKEELLDRTKKRESESASKTSRTALIKMVASRVAKMREFNYQTRSSTHKNWVPEYAKVLQIIEKMRIDRRTPENPWHSKPTRRDQEQITLVIGREIDICDVHWPNKLNELWTFFRRPDVTQEIIVAGCDLYFLEQTMKS